jgi:iron complex transport system substrate-binding protein
VVPPRLPVTVTDKDGRAVTISDVSRIIPLNGDLTEIVWARGGLCAGPTLHPDDRSRVDLPRQRRGD